MIAAGYVKFSLINGVDNPADILTKYLEPYKVEKITKPLLFWQGVLPDWPPVAKKQKRADEDDEEYWLPGYGECQTPNLSFTSFDGLYVNL